MPSSFRRRFDLPDGICYLDAAAITPRSLEAASEGAGIIGSSRRPWVHRQIDKTWLLQRARSLSASLIGAPPDDMAIVSAVSYGIATAAANLALAPGSRILTLEGDHPSSTLVWSAAAEAAGAHVEVLRKPADHDWTSALLDRIHSRVDPPIAVAVLPPLHWADGTTLDLARLAPALRAVGSALVIDATQAAGVLPLDVRVLRPDFVAFPAYKWLLGPYGCAFLYADPSRQTGRPLEHHMNNRIRPNLALRSGSADFGFHPGATRYDRGERDDPLILTLAVRGMELLAMIEPAERLAHVAGLTAQLAAGVAGLPVRLAPAPLRSPHVLGIELPHGEALPVVQRLETEAVYASARLGVLRVAPYLYNDENDVNRFCEALGRALSSLSIGPAPRV